MQGFIHQLFHPRTQDHESRQDVWSVALEQPSDYIWTGLGAGQSTAYLMDRYREHQMDEYIQMEYNSHNQYLQETMELGLGGLLLFVFAWLSIPWCARGKGRQTALFFTIIYALNMCTDCMFGRFCGIALWSMGMIYIMLQSAKQEE